jgi:hypothetical protein
MSAPWPTLQAAPNVDRPPWNWNPVETYLTAYTAMQKNQREQQEFQMAQEMDQILFPIKQQQAQLSLEKMQLEMERTKGEIERQRILTRQMTDVTRNTNRGFNEGLKEPNQGFNYFQAIKKNQTATNQSRVLVDFDQVSGQ